MRSPFHIKHKKITTNSRKQSAWKRKVQQTWTPISDQYHASWREPHSENCENHSGWPSFAFTTRFSSDIWWDWHERPAWPVYTFKETEVLAKWTTNHSHQDYFDGATKDILLHLHWCSDAKHECDISRSVARYYTPVALKLWTWTLHPESSRSLNY